jgi:hypothetical protein
LRQKKGQELNYYNEASGKGGVSRFLVEMLDKTSVELENTEAEIEKLTADISEQKGWSISQRATDLILTPKNFNLEMHKLDFKIIVHEESLTASGFDWELSPLIYQGYCRKTKSYRYTHGGNEHVWPIKSVTESMLMLEVDDVVLNSLDRQKKHLRFRDSKH